MAADAASAPPDDCRKHRRDPKTRLAPPKLMRVHPSARRPFSRDFVFERTAKDAIDGLAGAAEIVTAPMSLAKGLEFRAVVVIACDEGVLPLDERVADAADEAELDDIYETERRILYVACTRAREHLLVTGVTPVSEYLADLEAKAG